MLQIDFYLVKATSLLRRTALQLSKTKASLEVFQYRDCDVKKISIIILTLVLMFNTIASFFGADIFCTLFTFFDSTLLHYVFGIFTEFCMKFSVCSEPK